MVLTEAQQKGIEDDYPFAAAMIDGGTLGGLHYAYASLGNAKSTRLQYERIAGFPRFTATSQFYNTQRTATIASASFFALGYLGCEYSKILPWRVYQDIDEQDKLSEIQAAAISSGVGTWLGLKMVGGGKDKSVLHTLVRTFTTTDPSAAAALRITGTAFLGAAALNANRAAWKAGQNIF